MTVKPTLYHFAYFTEKNYRKLLKLAKKNYAFKFFNSYSKPPYVLWRHDVDCSVHRGLSLAKIEKELGVKSTYFFHLHSPYYNLLEEASHYRVKKILALGHEIGLHFELPFYPKIKTKNDLKEKLKFEKELVDDFFSVNVKVFSFHNPEFANALKFDDDKIAGMINTYGKTIRKNNYYCSDSNGYWRFKRLEDVLKEHQESTLHVLTHPEWWQKQAMSPKERLYRCIEFRAKRNIETYNRGMKLLGRKNIGPKISNG